MLIRLEVHDLAVIEAAELEFEPGFSVLTGETGAGKSLLVDALGLVLGDRGSAVLVRTGAKRASVSAEFEIPPSSPVRDTLAARELPEEESLTLHRQIGADGRSRAWVNGVPVPITVLRELGEGLVEIHGQHEHLALAQTEQQRLLFDSWAGCGDEALATQQAAHAVREARNALNAARESGQGREARIEFLRFQLQELDTFGPREGEYEALFVQYEQLRHREQIAAAIGVALDALEDGEHTALDALARAHEALAQLPEAAGLGETAELLAQAEALAAEAAQTVQRIGESEDDPQQLDALNERIARYQSLARKHGVEPANLHRQRETFAGELDGIDNSEERLETLEKAATAATGNWNTAAQALSKKRGSGAPRFAKAITEAVRALGMPHAEFGVTLAPADAGDCPASGAETVRFEVTTNKGQALRPIAQVASGGELSRLALAIEVLAHGGTGTPVMVFDEVDAGISGRVAELVGRQLKTLAKNAQVLCVTHLPQVGALADQHFEVSKKDTAGNSATEVVRLENEQRVEAIAAMLGGIKISDTAREHARELIAREKA
ncbi:MAG: DNA repair protein RecN [Gammaproteobacteria bacterium]